MSLHRSVDDELKEPEPKRMRLDPGTGSSSGNGLVLDASSSSTASPLVELNKEASLLSQLASPPLGMQVKRDVNGRIFIDRDPTHFRWILNYLRDGCLVALPATLQDRLELQQEVRYYQLQGLLPFVETAPIPLAIDGKESASSFLNARPTSKGVFFVPTFKWSFLGLSGAKNSWETLAFKFEDGVDDVELDAITLDADELNIEHREKVDTQKLLLEKTARCTFDIAGEPLEALFWFEKSIDRAYPQLFVKLSRGNIVFCSRGLDFLRLDQS